jgi:cobalt-zinc-cadmium efflux system protein
MQDQDPRDTPKGPSEKTGFKVKEEVEECGMPGKTLGQSIQKLSSHNSSPTKHGHSHSHAHGHSHAFGAHDHAHGAIGNIRFAFFLNLSFSILELVGGLWIGSMAIVADAIHDFGDAISLGTAWGLERYANRSRDRKFNFGYRRFSLLSALISGLVISTGSIFVIVESLQRLNQSQPPASGPMIALACVGLAINGFAAWRLSHGKTHNEKMLTWHLIEDVLGWGVVLVGALAIALTNQAWIDPALAVGLGIFVLFNVLKHLKTTIYLFLQGRPLNFSEDLFRSEALAVPGVNHIDHLAVWSLDGETSILSARLHLHSVRDPLEIEKIKDGVRKAALRQGAQATLETCLHEKAPHPKDEI